MAFPATRLRRLRQTGLLRGLVRETDLSVSHLVYPLFVVASGPKRSPIAELPGIDHLSRGGAGGGGGRAPTHGLPPARR
jgi:porphobilinogen synthase